MKNKNNKPRKIKNYLSSLSKWAKEHILSLFCLCCSLILLVGICASSCMSSKKTTAQASTIQTSSQRAILLNSMPNGFTQSGTVYYSYNYPIFLIPKTDALEIYMPQGNSNLTKIDLTTVSTANIVEYTGTSYFFFSFYRTTAGYATRNLSSICNIKVTINYDLLGLYEEHSPIPAFGNLLFDITTYQAVSGAGYLEYYFYNEDDDAVMSVSFTNLNTTGVYHSYTFGLNSFDFTYIDNEAFDYYYELGKQEGYEQGYDEGYNIGVNEGLGQGYNQGFNNGKQEGYEQGYDEGYLVGVDKGAGFDENPLKPFANGIANLINRDIFGNFSLGDLIALSFGLILFGFAIKIFLGG